MKLTLTRLAGAWLLGTAPDGRTLLLYENPDPHAGGVTVAGPLTPEAARELGSAMFAWGCVADHGLNPERD